MKSRDFAVDFVRLIAILGVVVIHTSTFFTGKSQPFSFDFYFLHIINQFMRFSVPAFFAISGYLLATHYSDMKSPLLFYKKRIYKILIPYLSCSTVYFLFFY